MLAQVIVAVEVARSFLSHRMYNIRDATNVLLLLLLQWWWLHVAFPT